MNEEQTQTLSLRAAYAFGAAHGLEHEVTDIREMVIEWDSSYTSSLRRGYIVALFDKHGLFDAFKKEHWSFGNTPPGERKRLRYLRIRRNMRRFWLGAARNSLPTVEARDHPILNRNWSSLSKPTFVIFSPKISTAS